ncbi:MAG: hypothetical protein ABI639_11580 [Thermoanaerobaculia bacterium]
MAGPDLTTSAGEVRLTPAAVRLAESWRDFRRLAWYWHALALALLIGFLAFAVRADLVSPRPTIDEVRYEEAFADFALGISPYEEPGYYYPPAFAFIGAFCTRELGVSGARMLFRGLNLLGAAMTCWIAAAWWRNRSPNFAAQLGSRFLVACLLMLGPPGVRLGFEAGNFSLTAAALIVGALHAAFSWPLAAGLILGLSLITKPLAAIAVPVVAGAALARKGERRIARRTIFVVGFIVVATVVTLPFHREMLALSVSPGTLNGTISLLRVSRLLHFEVHQPVLLILLSPLALFAGYRFANDRIALLSISLSLIMLTAPAIWPHTATVFFPLPVMAVSLARERYALRCAGESVGRSSAFELAQVAALATAVLFMNGGAFDSFPPVAQIVLLTAQLAAPLALGAYVLYYSTFARASARAGSRLRRETAAS